MKMKMLGDIIRGAIDHDEVRHHMRLIGVDEGLLAEHQERSDAE